MPIILDPYTIKDLRGMVLWARQDLLNTVMLLKAVGSEKAKISISSSESVLANLSLLLPKVRKIGRYERAERKIIEAIREKRLLLDDLERALQVVLDSEEGDVKT